jgi:hypothetical protein
VGFDLVGRLVDEEGDLRGIQAQLASPQVGREPASA